MRLTTDGSRRPTGIDPAKTCRLQWVLIPMRPRRLFVAASLLLALASAGIEQTLAHTDDGCELETHCSACLLQLGTPAVMAAVFAVPRIVPLEERVTGAPVVACEQAEPRHLPSRGPPASDPLLS